jgi:aminopeptidase-like protein
MNIKDELELYFDRLWPIHRSITGNGVRQTLDIISEVVPLETTEISSGTKVFDWTIPKEWVVRDAYIITPNGEKILDVNENNLHLLNYSIPFKGKVSKQILEKHLYSRPEMPDAIPYVTSYYEPRWGFCLAHNDRQYLPDGEYQIVIDTEFIDGSLIIGEAVLEGIENKEILLSTYICHPSLANNELSGPLVTAFLYRELSKIEERKFTYRFIFCPETIGSIAYLSMHGEYLKNNLIAGYIITCVGDDGKFTYKRSRRGDSLSDRAAEYVLNNSYSGEHRILDFFPVPGSDERQYCSPGFNLPVGSLMRTMYGEYPEYHTSKDNKSILSFEKMEEAIQVYKNIIKVIEYNKIYVNKFPYCEPNLGKRELYPTISTVNKNEMIETILWLLNYSDGQNDLLDISKISGVSIDKLSNAARKCLRAGLLEILNKHDNTSYY